MVTHQLKVRCRPGIVRWSETDVLPLSYTTNHYTTTPSLDLCRIRSRGTNRPMTCTSKCVTSLPAALAATHVYRLESACITDRMINVRAARSIRTERRMSVANDSLMYHVTVGLGLPVMTRHERVKRRPSATTTSSSSTSAMTGLTTNISGTRMYS